MLLITVRLPPDATLAQAMRRLKLPEEDVDTDYGLVRETDLSRAVDTLRLAGWKVKQQVRP